MFLNIALLKILNEMNKKDKIENNPSYAKMREEMEGFSALSNFMGLFGLGGKQWKEIKKQFPELKNQLEVLSKTPDKFNEYFAQRGWVAHESINFDAMKQAVVFAENGNLEEGEKVLIDQYSPTNMELKLHWLKNEEAFKIRYELILKAFEDYKEERYHSCVPLVLMLTDGAVNDITKSKGFYAEGTELTAWDSIAGHSSGLNVLKDIFTVGRNKTNTDKISIPYRNGILHGRDLGYANKKVAAKAWAAMFAIRDWAVALRKNGKDPQEPEPKPGFIESLKGLVNTIKDYEEHTKKHKESMQKIKAWKSRNMKLGEDFQLNSVSNDLTIGSPERCAVEFIENWEKKNFGKMASYMDYRSSYKESQGKLAGKMREQFSPFVLDSFELIEIIDQSPAISEIMLRVTITENDLKKTKDLPLRLIYENSEGSLSARGEEGYEWKIMDQNFWKLYG
jgi:hypothetical protein